MKNRFGRRFISHKEFLDYAKDLDLIVDHPSARLLGFAEKHGILTVPPINSSTLILLELLA